MEAMRNVYIAKHNAPPAFDAFRAYLDAQIQWEKLIRLVRQGALRRPRRAGAAQYFRTGDSSRQGASPKAQPGGAAGRIGEAADIFCFTEQEHAVFFDYCHVKPTMSMRPYLPAATHNEGGLSCSQG